ncbi:MAG TPA: Fic family protein [Ktedonobacterales bacterium]|nr:Fic family protein [Ktedonobacterales bacterium]
MIDTDNGEQNTSRQRAGKYVTQIGGYKAFIPKSLPPDPPIMADDNILALLEVAHLALGRLDGASEILPDVDLFVAMYVNKEAVLSSQIEGTQASLVDVLAFESEAAEPSNPQDIEEVVNYVNALNYGLERLATLPLSLRLIREIHQRLMAGVRGGERYPGEFRTTQNWIGHLTSTINTAKFVPPPPSDMLTALGDIETFLHSNAPLPVLIKVGLVHAQFETIHPFVDGNGRMGRLLITFILCQQRILRKPLLYLSHFFKMHKQAYYEHLQRVRDEGDWEGWLKFFLQGVYEVAEEATETARNIVQLRERHRMLIAKEFRRSSGAATQLLEHLYMRPIVTVRGVVEVTGQTYANANKLVSRFVELGILREMTQRERNRRFMYADYLRMFTDDELLDVASGSSE